MNSLGSLWIWMDARFATHIDNKLPTPKRHDKMNIDD
jgi:hypothetical protein